MHIQYIFIPGELVQDLLFETVAMRRIALLSRLAASGESSSSEKDLALGWLSELTADLEKRLDEYEIKNPLLGDSSGGGSSLQ